jgi:aspartyl-tRNA(Asn)/glutamyl-tRNA(Gln) amidotransferase subunit C
MNITDDTIRYVAALSHLNVDDSEMEGLKRDLGSILNYMDSLNELNTENVEPMSHVFDLKNVFRADETVKRDIREDLLKNAPDKKDGCFKVPKTVE